MKDLLEQIFFYFAVIVSHIVIISIILFTYFCIYNKDYFNVFLIGLLFCIIYLIDRACVANKSAW